MWHCCIAWWIQRHIVVDQCIYRCYFAETISSMMGLTPLGKQKLPHKVFDKTRGPTWSLQARKAITALENSQVLPWSSRRSFHLMVKKDQVADYMNLVLNFGFISMPGNQAMQGHVLQPFDFEKVTVGRPWNTETPIPKTSEVWGDLPHQHPSCASFPTFQSNACWLTKVSYARQRPVPKVEEGIGAWRSILTFVAYMGVTCTCYIETWDKIGPVWFMIWKRLQISQIFHQPQQHQILQRKPVGCW